MRRMRHGVITAERGADLLQSGSNAEKLPACRLWNEPVTGQGNGGSLQGSTALVQEHPDLREPSGIAVVRINKRRLL
jgi:hypothetical protein